MEEERCNFSHQTTNLPLLFLLSFYGLVKRFCQTLFLLLGLPCSFVSLILSRENFFIRFSLLQSMLLIYELMKTILK